VQGAEWAVVTVECERRPVTHGAGLVIDGLGCGGHDVCIDIDGVRHETQCDGCLSN
jgi:hypothetical protein